MIEHITITVSGKVQGVYYRASTHAEAIALGVVGIVRNEPDGCVYIEAEGTRAQLDALVAWCRQGPPLARVDRCDVQSGTVKHYTDFSIQQSKSWM